MSGKVGPIQMIAWKAAEWKSKEGFVQQTKKAKLRSVTISRETEKKEIVESGGSNCKTRC